MHASKVSGKWGSGGGASFPVLLPYLFCEDKWGRKTPLPLVEIFHPVKIGLSKPKIFHRRNFADNKYPRTSLPSGLISLFFIGPPNLPAALNFLLDNVEGIFYHHRRS